MAQNMMEAFASESQCPRCNAMKVRQWEDLTEDQQYLISALPDFEEMTMSELRRSRFCTKCWFRKEVAQETYA
jgi:hypothetical protein